MDLWKVESQNSKATDYSLWVGKADYVEKAQQAIWMPVAALIRKLIPC